MYNVTHYSQQDILYWFLNGNKLNFITFGWKYLVIVEKSVGSCLQSCILQVYKKFGMVH